MPDNELNLTDDRNLENVEEYRFNLPPIKGFPELRWAGKRPFRSTHYYPAQLKENHGEPVDGWMNEIYWGDNLQVMSHLLKKYRGQIDLIYIDPPFDSKAEYKKGVKLRSKTVLGDQSIFEEKQYADVWTNDEYLQFMYERLVLSRELLSEEGSLYLHCDWHKSHYLRSILEEIFGLGGKDGTPGFRNEVIWCYSDAANSKTYWNTKHDAIFFVTKGSKWTFNYQDVLRPVKESTKKKYKYEDEIGRYRLFGRNIEGSPIRWHRDVEKRWEDTNPELVFRHYMKDGSLPLDWWTINPVNQVAKEKENYPTQKPEKLLERIIRASSNPGDIVFDFFMGSGTTQSVALKLGRKFIGADINLGSVQTTTKRLLQVGKSLSNDLLSGETYDLYTGISIYTVNNYEVFRNPVQARELLIEALEIQKLPSSIVFDGEKDGRLVKILPNDINRIATKADLNELISNLDYKSFERRQEINPNQPVEHITLVCMGHDSDLAASLQHEVPFKLDIEVVDILRDRQDIQFKRDSEAAFSVEDGKLRITEFFPMNLLSKLSLMKENVTEWREMVESIMIDFNYDGVVFEPQIVDVPVKNELVKGRYSIPADASTIRVKITDLLSESFEGNAN